MSYNINESNQERQGLLGNNYNRLAVKYFNQLSIPSNSRILDLGCGQGEATRLLHQIFSPTDCIGFDMDEALLKIARNKNENGNGPSFQQGNAKKLPFDNDQFDLVYARLLLLHVPDFEEVANEMIRVTKPNGTIMVQDLVIPNDVGLHPKHWAFEKTNQAMRELFANPEVGKQLPLTFHKMGLNNITIRSDIYLLHQTSAAKKLMRQTAEGMIDGMIEKGIIEESEVPDFIDQLKQIEQDNSYTFLTNPFITIWGKV